MKTNTADKRQCNVISDVVKIERKKKERNSGKRTVKIFKT